MGWLLLGLKHLPSAYVTVVCRHRAKQLAIGKRAIGNEQSAIGNEQSAIGNEQSAIGIDNEQLARCRRRGAHGDQHSASGNASFVGTAAALAR
jgi:hypothetical protein